MRKKSTIFTMAMAVILTISLAACSSSNNAGTTKAPDSTTAATTDSKAADTKIDTSKFVTISYVMMGDKPKNGQLETVMEKVNAIMKEKINAKLELKWVEWADWQTKYNLLLASGEPIDLITIGTDWLDTWPNAEKGAFLPLDNLLPKYAPVTWQEIPAEDWEQSKSNKQIVLIPEDHFTQWVNHGFYYRGDWAKEFGITSPIKDFETLGKYLQGVKDNKKDVVPYDANGTNGINLGGYINSTTDAIDLNIPTGYSNIFFAKSFDDKYTAYSPVFDDTAVNFAKLMKEWADKGFWREDVLNNKTDNRAALKAGKSALDQHHTQTFKGLRVEMDKAQPGSELQMFAFSDTRNNLISMPITHGGTSIGAHSKNPERALMVYEMIRQNKEVYQLMNFGLEGVQYEIKDGKRTRPAGYDEAKHGFSTNFWGGRMDKFEIPTDTDWTGMPDIYAKYDKIKKPYPYGRMVFNKSAVDAEMTAVTETISKLLPAIAYGKVADPVKAVEEFRAKLKTAGYDKVLAEIQKQLDAYKTLVETK
jgi:putative aldouronate transport system substrate-binding protein